MKSASPHRLVRTGSRHLALALVSLLAVVSAQASTYWWDTNTTGLWATNTNWWTTVTGTTSPATAPLAADSVVFNGTGKNGATVVQLNAATPITGITFANTGTTLINASAAGTQALTIGTGGITLNSGAGAVTIGDATNQAPITLGGAQAWTNNSASLFTVVNAVTNGSNLLTIDGTGNTTINGVIGNGSGGLAKIGTGTLTLTGANTYSGTTTVGTGSGANAGTLRLSGSGKISNAATTVYGGTLDLNGTTQTITTLTLGGGAAGSTATVSIGAGELQLGGDVTYTATNNPNGATLSSTTTGKLSLLGNRMFTVGDSSAAAADLFVSAIIQNGDASARSLTKEGAGTLILSGANTYSGATNINVGVLNIQHATGLGTAAAGTTLTAGAALQIQNNITVSAETLTLGGAGISNDGALRNISGANTWQGTVTLAGPTRINSDAGTLTFDTAANSITGTNQNLTLGGAAGGTVYGTITTGNGTLTKDGAGTWTLGGSNTYTGATTLTAGTLSVGTAANLGSATNALVFDGGTLQVTGATLHNFGSHATTFNLTKTVGLDIYDGGNTFTVSQVLNQTTGGLTKLGDGTLVLTNTNTYTGATTLSGGILSVATIGDGGVAGNLGQASNAAANLVIGNATLRYTGSTAGSNRAFTISGGQTATFDITTGATTLTLSGAAAASSGSLTKIGAGTLILAGANAYTGATTVSAGILKAGITNAFGNNSAVTLDDAAGVTMDITGFNTVIGSLSGGGTSGGNLTLGAATLTVGGDNTSTAYAGVITGLGGALIKTGSGMLTLSGTNGFTGATTLTAGTVSVDTAANLGASNPLVFDGGTLQITGTALASYGGGFLGTHAVTLTAGKTVGFDIDDSGHTFTVSQVLNQTTGGLTKLGAGTLILSNTNTYTGATALSAGKITVGVLGTLASGALGTNSALTMSSGSTLDLNIYNTWIGSLTGNGTITLGTATLTVGGNNTNPAAFSGTISGSGSLTKIGSGTLILSGTNGYTGATTLSEGVLSVSSLASLGSTTNPLIFNGGTLQVTGGAAANFGSHVVTFNTGQTVVFDITGSNTFTASQTLNQGAGGLTKLGTGTLVLSGPNTFSGPLDMQNGTLKVATVNDASADGVFGNSALPVILGHSGPLTGTLQYTGGGTVATSKKFTLATGGTGKFQVDTAGTVLTLSGAIDGGGNLIKSGTGTLILSGANTLSGRTTIASDGILQLGANNAISSSVAVDIGAYFGNTFGLSGGGTLDLNGFNNAVAGLKFGNQSNPLLVKTGTGTLTLNGPIDQDSEAKGTKLISGNLSLGGGNRTINNSGSTALTISAVISNGRLTNNGNLVLSGANIYADGTTLTSGTLQIGTDPVTSPSFLSSAIGTGTLTMGAGGISSNSTTPRTIPNAVAFTGNNSTTTTLGNATNNGRLIFSGSVDLTNANTHAISLSSDVQFDGVITGASGGNGFTVVGSGVLTLTHTGNNFSGKFGAGSVFNVSSAAGGTVRWGASNVFPDAATLLVGGSGTIDLAGFSDTAGGIAFGTSSGGNNAVISTGSGTLTLNGNIEQDSNAPTTKLISGNLSLGGGVRTINNAGAGALTISAAISNGGINNNSNTILSGQNTYTGNTTLTSGNLRVDSAEIAGVSGPLGKPTTPTGSIIFAGGTLQYSAANSNQFDYVSRFTTTGTNPYSIDTNSQNVTFTNGLGASGTSGLTKLGAGILTLTNANSYTGATTITGGILAATQAATLPNYGTSAKVVINGGTLGVNIGGGGTDWTTTQVDTLLANATKTSGALGIDTTNNPTGLTQWTAFTTTNFGNTLGLTKLGSNTLTLNLANTYNGTTTVNAGTLLLAANHTLAVNKPMAVNTGGTLDLGSNNQYVGQFSGSGGIVTGVGSRFTVNPTAAASFAGSIQGSVNLAKVGTQTLTLTGSNTSNGTLSVLGGGLTLKDAGTLANTSGITVGGATLTLDNTGTADLSEPSGRLNNAAPITLNLGALSYYGRSSTASTETLGTVTANTGMSVITVAAGSSGSAALTLGSLTRNSGATLRLAGPNGTSGNNPRLLVTGGIAALTGTLTPVNGVVPGVFIGAPGQPWSNVAVGYVDGLGFATVGTAGGFPATWSGAALNTATSTSNVTGATAWVVKSGGQTINSLARDGNITFLSDSDVLIIGSGMTWQGKEPANKLGVEGGIRGKVTSGTGELFWLKTNEGSGGGAAGNINSVITDNGGTRVKFVVAAFNRNDLQNQRPYMTANNTYTGGTTMSGGNTLLLGASISGWTTIPAANDPTQGLVINDSSVTMQGYQGQIAPTNIVTLNGGSTLTLTGANQLAGLVFNSNGGNATPTVTGGTLLTLTGNISSTPTVPTVTPLIGTVPLDFNGTSAHDITVTALPEGNYVNNQTALNGLAISSVIQNGGFTKKGDGVLYLTGNNTFTGDLTVQEGVVNVATFNETSAAGPLGKSTNAVVLGGSGGKTGVIEYSGGSGNVPSTRLFTLATGGTGGFQVDTAGATLTLSGQIDGSGSLAKTGAGTLTLSGAKTYGGNTTVKAGTLKFDSTGSIANSPQITVGDTAGSTARLDVNALSGGLTVVSGQTLGGSGTISGPVNVSGVLSPGASIETLASDALTLNHLSTFAYEVNSSVAATVGADLQKVTGALNLNGTVTLSLTDIADLDTAFPTNTIFSLINYSGVWNSGLFTIGGSARGDETQFSAGLNTWKIDYDATSGGANFSAEQVAGKFVNITAMSGASVSAYKSWIDGYTDIPVEDRDPQDDPDHDGANNLAEFAFKGVPNDSSKKGVFVTQIKDNIDGDLLKELTFTCAVRRSDTVTFPASGVQTAMIDNVTYTIEANPILTGTWDSTVSYIGKSNTDPTGSGLPSLLGTAWEYCTFSAFNGLGGKGFLHAKVTLP